MIHKSITYLAKDILTMFKACNDKSNFEYQGVSDIMFYKDNKDKPYGLASLWLTIGVAKYYIKYLYNTNSKHNYLYMIQRTVNKQTSSVRYNDVGDLV